MDSWENKTGYAVGGFFFMGMIAIIAAHAGEQPVNAFTISRIIVCSGLLFAGSGFIALIIALLREIIESYEASKASQMQEEETSQMQEEESGKVGMHGIEWENTMKEKEAAIWDNIKTNNLIARYPEDQYQKWRRQNSLTNSDPAKPVLPESKSF